MIFNIRSDTILNTYEVVCENVQRLVVFSITQLHTINDILLTVRDKPSGR